MNPYRNRLLRFLSLRSGIYGIHQHGCLLLIKGEIRHCRCRTPERTRQLPWRFSGGCTVKVHRKTVAAPGTDVASPAGQPVHQLPTFFQERRVVEGKTDIFSGPQPGMGDVFAFRGRIAAMTAAATAALRIMDGMACQAELTWLNTAPCRKRCRTQDGYQGTNDQSAPLKNSATTVSSTIAAVMMTVITDTARCSRGKQQAR